MLPPPLRLPSASRTRSNRRQPADEMKSTQTRKGEGESRAMRRVAPRFLERSAASLPFEASPNEFQRKLNVSGFTRAKNLTYGRIGYVSHGVGEVRLVKGVEEL